MLFQSVALMAQRLGIAEHALCERVMRIMGERLYRLIADFLLKRALGRRQPDGPRLLGLGYEGRGDEIACQFVCRMPLIGIGAPTHVVLPLAARALHARSIAPEYAEVANALGAISGSVLSEERIIIKPHYETYGITGYSGHASRVHRTFATLEEATQWAREEAQRAARENAVAMGALQVEVAVEEHASSGQPNGESDALLLEHVVIARGMGKPAFDS